MDYRLTSLCPYVMLLSSQTRKKKCASLHSGVQPRIHLSHTYFKSPVEQLTGAAINKLQAYWLSEEQWNLAEKLSDILEVIILVFHKQITDFNFVTDFWRTNKTVFTISGSSYCRCLTYAGFHWTINNPCLWWWRHGVAKCCPCCSSSSPSSDWQILLSHEEMWAIHNCYRLVLFFSLF